MKRGFRKRYFSALLMATILLATISIIYLETYSNQNNINGNVISPITGNVVGDTSWQNNIPASHPRLWWNSTRITQAQQWYNAHPFTLPTITNGDHAFLHALASIMTGNTQYCTNAVNWLVGYSLPAGQVLPSAIGSDASRWDGENAILIYDWCWNQMSASQRSTVIGNWNTWLGNINQQSWGGVGMEQNNYYWGNLRNSLEWGIATYGENSQAQSFINNALVTRWENSFIPHANNAVAGKGGVLQEGPGYGAVIPWYSTIPFETVNMYGRDVSVESNFFKESIMYLVYSTTLSQTTRKGDLNPSYELFQFNDDEYPQNSQIYYIRTYYGDAMTYFANHWKNLPLGQYARQWINTIVPKTTKLYSAFNSSGSALAFSNLPLDYYAPGPGFFYTKNSWNPSSTSINLQLGAFSAVGHSHKDSGTFQIWKNGKWMSRETTGYAQNIIGYNGASVGVIEHVAHNGLLFNGVGQLSDSWTKGKPVVTRLESKSDYSYASVDLGDIYKANADFAGRVPESPTSTTVREFIFIKPLETLLIFDRIGSASSSFTKTFLLHSETNPVKQDNTHYILGNGGLRLSALTPGLPSDGSGITIVNEGTSGVGQYRMQEEISGSAVSYLINVLDSSGQNVAATLVDNGNTFIITIGSYVIVLNKGISSVGGTINGNALRNDVQGISVTDNGPVWSGTVVGPTLTVSVNGGGSVSSNAGGITACTGICSASYLSGQSIILTATPTSGTSFLGWGGDCSSAGTSASCSLNMGTSDKNVVASFSLPVPPVAPIGFGASSSSAAVQVDLVWGLVTNAVSYNAYRSNSPTGPFIAIASGITGTSYLDTAVSPLTTYYYRVTAVNAGGESSPSVIVGVTTSSAGGGNPTGNLISDSGFESGNAGFSSSGYNLDNMTRITSGTINGFGSLQFTTNRSGDRDGAQITYSGTADKVVMSGKLRADIAVSTSLGLCPGVYYSDGSFVENCTSLSLTGKQNVVQTFSVILDLDDARTLNRFWFAIKNNGVMVTYTIDDVSLAVPSGANYHPADKNTDNKINNTEISAYNFCWKTPGCTTYGGPISTSFVSNANFIWKSRFDSLYHYDSTLSCPGCYISG